MMRVEKLGNDEVVIIMKDPATKKVVQKIYINEEDGITFEDVVAAQVVHSQVWSWSSIRTKLPKDRCKATTSGGPRGIRCVFAAGHAKGTNGLVTRPLHGAPIGTGFGEWGDTPKKKRRK